MGPDPKILDDIARVAGGAVNIASGMQQQIREEIKSRMDDMAHRMDLVPREDLDRAMAMIAALEKRVEALENRGKNTEKKSAAPQKKDTATKATSKTKKK